MGNFLEVGELIAGSISANVEVSLQYSILFGIAFGPSLSPLLPSWPPSCLDYFFPIDFEVTLDLSIYST